MRGFNPAQHNMMGINVDDNMLEEAVIASAYMKKIKNFMNAVMLDRLLKFNILYFVVSIIGVFNHICFSFLLLDVLSKIRNLEIVTRAVTNNYKQLLATTLLLGVVIYIYSFIAFSLFRDDYLNTDLPEGRGDDAELNSYCDSLIHCFASTINNGIRAGGGIGEMIE